MAKEQSILLEAGTNEMELLVFKLGETRFGINVAKVREIIERSKTFDIPYSAEVVEGTFKLRDQVLTLINLGRYFQMQGQPTQQGQGMTIIVEFSNLQCGILVDQVDRIHRLNWEQIQPPSQYLASFQAPLTGMVNIDDQIVLILDFETIISNILGIQSVDVSEQPTNKPICRQNTRILLVDDSSIVRKSLIHRLNQEGFDNLTICTDGQHAWETLESGRSEPDGPCDLVLSDIEMPRMDGLHLTSRIKGNPDLKHIPVILFSSLITRDNYKKGQSVGADAQIHKPDSAGLIEAIEEFLPKAE